MKPAPPLLVLARPLTQKRVRRRAMATHCTAPWEASKGREPGLRVAVQQKATLSAFNDARLCVRRVPLFPMHALRCGLRNIWLLNESFLRVRGASYECGCVELLCVSGEPRLGLLQHARWHEVLEFRLHLPFLFRGRRCRRRRG